MRAGLPQKEPKILARWEEIGLTAKAARGRRRHAEIRAARRAALRQWQYPYRPCAQQDPQGRGDPHPADAGQGLRLRAGLGLPRPADRMEDRGGEYRAKGRNKDFRSRRDDRLPPGMPRLRRTLARGAARGVQAPRRRRRLGSVPIRPWTSRPKASIAARNHEIRRQRAALSRLQAGDVVGGGKDRAGRGGGGI